MAPQLLRMSRRDVTALVVLAGSVVVVGFGCLATYGLLREYADFCGETAPLAQVWSSGAGLGPAVPASPGGSLRHPSVASRQRRRRSRMCSTSAA